MGRRLLAQGLATTFLLLLLAPPVPAEIGEADILQEFKDLQSQCEEAVRSAKYEEAEQTAQKLLELARGPLRQLPLNLGVANHLLGKIYYHQGRLTEAERAFREAVDIYQDKLGQYHPQFATALHELAVVLHAQGRYTEAEPLYQEALRIRRKTLLPGDPALGTTVNNLALLYWQQARYEQAESLYLEALGIYQKAFGQEHSYIATLLNNLGELYRHWGRYALAESYHQKALQMRIHLGGEDHPDVADTLANIAQLYLAQGRYAEAEHHLRSALHIRKRRLGENHALVGITLANLAALYQRQDRPSEAEQLYRQAQGILQRVFHPDHPTLAAVQMGLGHVYLSQAQYRQAETHYQKALEIRQKAFGREHPLVGDSLAALGLVCTNLSRFEEAERWWQQALEQHRRAFGTQHPTVARDLYGLAQTALAQQEFLRAESLLAQAEQILQQTYSEGQLLARIYADRAQILWKTERPQEALAVMQRAFQVVEQQRVHISGGEWERGEFLARWAGLYEQMIHWQRHSAPPAQLFTTMERCRARTLLEQMELAGMDLLAGLPETQAHPLRQREAQLAGQLASLLRQWELLQIRSDLSPAQKDAEQQRLLSAIRTAQADYAQAYTDLQNASPTYRLLGEGGPRPVDWEALTTWIKKHHMLFLEYFLGQQASYVLVVVPDGQAELYPLELSEEQAHRLNVPAGPLTASRFQKVMIREGGSGVLDLLASSINEPTEAQAAERLAVLWEVLLPAKCREGLITGRYALLGVVPDGALVWLPFETLVIDTGPPPKYLLDVGPPVLYGPSATVLVKLAQRTAQGVPPASEPVLALGDCIYRFWPGKPPAPATMAHRRESNPPAPETEEQTPLAYGYPALKHSREEVQAVAEVFGKQGVSVRTLLQEEATEANLRQQSGGRRILHLSCHGRVDPAWGHLFGAFLALTPGPHPQDPGDDGVLTVQESCRLNLAGCELAILSACETNRGQPQPGEGVWSLARGFLVAGARRVVAGNWLLDDQAAAHTVRHFCAALASQEAALAQAQQATSATEPASSAPVQATPPNYAAALHEAKRWLRSHRQWHTPYYWAPLILIGPP